MSFYTGELLFPIDATNPAFANTLGAADFDGNGLLDVIVGFSRVGEPIRNKAARIC